MKFRAAVVLAAPLALCVVASAQAAPAKAPAPLAFTDAKGDGNAINDQGLVAGSPAPAGTVTPAAVDGADITGLTIAATGAMATRKVGRKAVRYFNCTGYTATLTLAGSTLPNAALYRVQAGTALHDTYWLEYSMEAGADPVTTLRYTDAAATLGTSRIVIANAKVEGNKITFAVTDGNLKATGEKLGKTVLDGFGADIRGNAKAQGSGATLPMFDQLKADAAKAWKVCPQ